ncbi:hypothetical protein C9424_19735 [Arthrobacter sp. H-02-3]|nr:hypothetical protein C9424_19735 [Arthrobacter sp. H-02-3]
MAAQAAAAGIRVGQAGDRKLASRNAAAHSSPRHRPPQSPSWPEFGRVHIRATQCLGRQTIHRR